MNHDPRLLIRIDNDRLRIGRAMTEEIDDVGFVPISNIAGDGAGEARRDNQRIRTSRAGRIAIAADWVVVRIYRR